MIVVGQPLAPPRLRGTDSQIAWALRIRAQMVPEIHAIRDGSAGRLRIGALSSEEAEGYSAIVEAADTLRLVLALKRSDRIDTRHAGRWRTPGGRDPRALRRPHLTLPSISVRVVPRGHG
jgi:hypothetical protein